MFLLKVYRYNKLFFVGILFFMLGQLAINYKRGMVFSPWYHYGMFSAKEPVRDTYAITLVRGTDNLPWAPQAWDRVYVTLWQYQSLTVNDSLYTNEISRLFRRVGFAAPNKNHYVPQVATDAFLNWYKVHLQQSNLLDVNKFELQPIKAVWNGRQLLQVNP